MSASPLDPTQPSALDVLVVCNPVWEVTARLGEPLSAREAWKRGQRAVATTALEAIWGTGGSASNTAAALARKGRMVGQVGSVGSDEAGEQACSFSSGAGGASGRSGSPGKAEQVLGDLAPAGWTNGFSDLGSFRNR